MPEPQRHLLTTHLDTIAQRTGLEPGAVDIHKKEWSAVAEWTCGYWLDYAFVLTGTNYDQHLAWVWSLETTQFPADYRREQPWTARREIPDALAQDLLGLVTQGATPRRRRARTAATPEQERTRHAQPQEAQALRPYRGV